MIRPTDWSFDFDEKNKLCINFLKYVLAYLCPTPIPLTPLAAGFLKEPLEVDATPVSIMVKIEPNSVMLTHSCPYNPNCHHQSLDAQIDYAPRSPIPTKIILRN